MQKLSIKIKIMLWFSLTLLILVLAESAINLTISRHVLDQSLKERLVTVVDTNVEEIEYYNSGQAVSASNPLSLSYNGGFLEIDDDFCDYYEGVCTALVDSNNDLLYGESPILIDESSQFSFTSVGSMEYKGQTYFVYEKKLSSNNLDGLWLRGVVSEKEATYMLDNIISMEIWLLPILSILVVLGGYVITKRSFLPIEKITDSANAIVDGNDLTKRIDIGEGKDEIHKLAETFNGMFDRLEKSFESERQFASDASHELRTPVSVIKAHCEFALEFAQTEEDYKEALEVINRQSDTMSSLLSQLLFFTRLEQDGKSIQLKTDNLSNLINDLCEDRAILLKGQRNLETAIDIDVFVPFDKNLMIRLFNNLFDNAIKYSAENSLIKVNLAALEDRVELSIEDNGIGIADKNIGKIWNRFYQEDSSRTDNSGGSFGLGLSMVREIADIHNGFMKVKSKAGVGSCFTLVLPK